MVNFRADRPLVRAACFLKKDVHMNSSTVIVSNVFSLLREFYEAYGFRWEYWNFFARLLNCSPNAPFARAAEFFMRVEYPGFQRRDAFFRWGTEMILSAVHRQAAAVEA